MAQGVRKSEIFSSFPMLVIGRKKKNRLPSLLYVLMVSKWQFLKQASVVDLISATTMAGWLSLNISLGLPLPRYILHTICQHMSSFCSNILLSNFYCYTFFFTLIPRSASVVIYLQKKSCTSVPNFRKTPSAKCGRFCYLA